MTAGIVRSSAALATVRQSNTIASSLPLKPVGDLISETASVRSGSVSRASSRPPSSAGPPLGRPITKSQLKKQRRENRKGPEKEVEVTPQPATLIEQEIAPILGKKKKKDKRLDHTAEDSTPLATGPSSPIPEATPADAQNPPVTDAADAPKAASAPTAEINTPIEKESEASSVQKVEATDDGDESAPKANTTPASIISSLIASKELAPSQLAFFKSVTSVSSRYDFNDSAFEELSRKLSFSDQDHAHLSEGMPVHVAGTDDSILSRVLITPGGYLLRGLSPEQEQHFIELEKRVMQTKRPVAYIPSRKGAENGFYMVAGRVVQSGPASMTAMATAASSHLPSGYTSAMNPSKAASKIRVHEALNYINQFVLPALPAHPNAAPQPVTSGSKKVDANPFNFKFDANNLPSTGRAPDPSTYTACVASAAPGHNSPSGSGDLVQSTTNYALASAFTSHPIGVSSSNDLAGVVHGMVSSIASAAPVAGSGGDGGSSAMGGKAAAHANTAMAAADRGLLSCVPLLGVSEAEAGVAVARKEMEAIEKKLVAVMKRNRRTVLGNAGGTH
ncbi:MAG: hypothetical protein M1826_003752 [Phylliscum demangeonii]|nr:MAG: hypothetical protein M1826_003752 [Phylliscum demangeonii]